MYARRGIHHLVLCGGDRERAEAFFTLVGATVEARGEDFVRLRFGAAEIEIRGGGRAPPEVDHVALEVDDLALALAALQGRGLLPAGAVVERPDSRSAYFGGPDGLMVELIELHPPRPGAPRP